MPARSTPRPPAGGVFSVGLAGLGEWLGYRPAIGVLAVTLGLGGLVIASGARYAVRDAARNEELWHARAAATEPATVAEKPGDVPPVGGV